MVGLETLSSFPSADAVPKMWKFTRQSGLPMARGWPEHYCVFTLQPDVASPEQLSRYAESEG